MPPQKYYSELVPNPDGEWVKYADHAARLAQLAQEQATLQAMRPSVDAVLDLEHSLEAAGFKEGTYYAVAVDDLVTRLKTAEAALGETRQALQHLTEKYDALLSRVDTPGVSDALVPQPRVGETSTDR